MGSIADYGQHQESKVFSISIFKLQLYPAQVFCIYHEYPRKRYRNIKDRVADLFENKQVGHSSFVRPWGVEPQSMEPESSILSIEL